MASTAATENCDKCDGKHATDACPYYPHPRWFSKNIRTVCKTGIQHHTSYYFLGKWKCCERTDENDTGCVFGETIRHHPKDFVYWSDEGNYGYNWDCCFRDYRDDPGCKSGIHPSNSQPKTSSS